MPTYLSPGVYVEEVSSGSAPIAGAGTSVAGFIGIFQRKSPAGYYINKISQEKVGVGDGNKKIFSLKNYPVATDKESVTLPESIPKNSEFKLNNVTNDKISNIEFTSAPPDKSEIIIDYWTSVSSGEIKLITNFTEFKQFFGDFTKDNPEQNIFAHAVYGFFRNGGTRAYVTWVSDTKDVDGVLNDFEAIDEISIVVAPGQADANIIGKIKDHAAKMGDRIAILDCQPATDLGSETKPTVPGFTSYAAFYFPWIQVYDPATKINIFVPPSGHIAGVYARVDGERGVHKAPANVPLLGALDLQFNISKAKQDRLNPQGVNVIRKLNGNILVWGARTLGGDANLEFKYINVRRHFCYLKDSIDKGTQWVVFEPNTPELWAKIRRNISAFLTLEWRKGALFGTTPQEAFYVKCDAENNPPALRDLGQVVIEIGVAAVKPAEFVIFRLSQWSGTKE
ncbi:phage tail sheath family protein [Dolichospermum planctonicum]|uniref:Phage tail sheath protein n=1 Tax=Dolichospermum planctonicum TaxID=136072 RepID=A0A480A8B2_9CYAN|nr:phage tail sheath subtilisin-like domain-containing protein [Dolichospermum planctonicum]GCL40762.1 phage tail sheath protein [Dolichospermum planctonicum]